MRIYISVLLLFLIQSLSAQETFKVMTYHVGKGIGTEKEAIKEFQTWMKELDLDVIAFQNVQETDVSNFAKIAKKWKHKHVAIKEFEGYATVVTSKTPINSTSKANQLIASTNGIEFYVLDFQQDSLAARIQIAQEIANDASGKEKTMILGYLNSYAPADSQAYNRRFRLIPREARGDSKLIQQLSSYQRSDNYKAVRQLLEVGFQDIYASLGEAKSLVRGTYPTKVFGQMPQYNVHRYDYILATQALEQECQSIEILQNEKTHFLSSHYPLIATFVLK